MNEAFQRHRHEQPYRARLQEYSVIITDEEAVVDGVVDGPAAHRRHDDVHAEVEHQEEPGHRLHARGRHGS